MKKLLIVAVIALVFVAGLTVLNNQRVFADGAGSPVECSTNPNTNPSAANVLTNSGTDDLVSINVGAGNYVTGVCIKSGNNMFQPNKHSLVLGNGVHENGCYQVTGVGTQTATVTRLDSGPTCQGISHIDVLFDEGTPPDPQPQIDYLVSCDVATQKVTVQLINGGNAEGSATVNGQSYVVDAGTTEQVPFNAGIPITIQINQRTVYEETPVCVGGRGGEDPQTPVTEVAQVEAPKAGVNAGGSNVAVLAILATSIASIAFGVLKLRKAGQ